MPLDIGIGLILGTIIHNLSELSTSLTLTLGVIACLLPDMDYVWAVIINHRLPHSEHRDGLHYPLLLTPAVGLFGLIFNPYIGLLLASGVLLHLLHDSIGVGCGVKWLFPFKKSSYLFLYKVGLPTNQTMPRKRMYSLSDQERAVAISQYGDPQWIRHIYFSLHPFGLIEYTVFLLGVLAAIRVS